MTDHRCRAYRRSQRERATNRARVYWDRRVEAGVDWPARFGGDFETYWTWWLARKAPYPDEPGGGLFGPD